MIIVVGGGPAGRMAALRLAGAGREVTILEKRALGGQCVHDGCMLVCALNDVARSIMSARHLEEMGILSGNVSVDYPALLEKLEATQDKLRYILNMETTGAGVKVEYGVEAEVRDGVVYVDGKPREAEAVIIAAGGQMNIPDVEGKDLPGTYNARTLRSMPALPKRLVIIGGGISAAEFAYIYAAFGCEVTLIARSSLLSMLPSPLLADARRDLSAVDIRENTPLEKILGTDRVEGVVAGGETIPCDAVLFATGVKPESPFVSGVAKGADGAILVNEQMETSIPGVYAAGDIIGGKCFTPAARLQGFAAADAILGNPRKVDLSQIPFSVVLGLDYTVCPPKTAGEKETMPNIAGPGSYWHVLDGTVGHMQLETGVDGTILGFASSGPSTSLVGTYLGYLVRKGVTVHEFSPMLEVHPNSDGLYSLIRFSAQ
ncbi:NAD(P)/FAD-dependent oxidoreductase [Methanocorpusculaceae archaeon]|nr:NAD(P)/FAD-dependent oxidoreductase [Methanocorpusculaceae archaeon]